MEFCPPLTLLVGRSVFLRASFSITEALNRITRSRNWLTQPGNLYLQRPIVCRFLRWEWESHVWSGVAPTTWRNLTTIWRPKMTMVERRSRFSGRWTGQDPVRQTLAFLETSCSTLLAYIREQDSTNCLWWWSWFSLWSKQSYSCLYLTRLVHVLYIAYISLTRFVHVLYTAYISLTRIVHVL